jgi:PST family polysaccharide transporter
MNLVKTSLLNGIAVLVRLGSTIFVNKILAVHVGPAGYAVIGQFQSLVSLATTLANGAVNTGVTKYTAQHGEDRARQAVLWRSAATLGLLGTALLAGLLIALRRPLARWALGDEALSSVMVWLAGALVLLVLNGLMLAILNGLKAVRAHVLASIAGSLLTVVVASGLVLKFGLYGALVALAISQALACLATAVIFARHCPLPLRSLLGGMDRQVVRRLGAFALMGLTSAIAAPVGQVLIRNGLATQLGWEGAGLWQALSKLSETHLMLLTTTLSLYFLPRFSEIREGQALRAEVVKGLKFVVPLVCLTSATIFVLRESLVHLLFTRQFLPLIEALGMQLLGDVLKIASWVLAFTLLSHARTRAFIATELLFTALLVVSSLWLGRHFGLMGVASGYALTYALYGLTMAWLFTRLTTELTAAPPAHNTGA